MFHRRELLNSVAIASGATLLTGRSAFASDENPTSIRIIDTNVSLFQWPFRRIPLDDPVALVDKLRSLGITQAWAGSFEGIFHRDVTSVNERLADVCKSHTELLPIGSINLELPGWAHDLERCAGKHGMSGIRIHPNYHGYTLDDPRCSELLKLATQNELFIQIVAKIEDTRTQHRLAHVPDVDLSPLPRLMHNCPGAKIQILNDHPRGKLLERLAKTEGIFFDVSRVEGTDGISKLLAAVPSSRVLFGSHAPFLIPEAALIRIGESELSVEVFRSLLWANAGALISQVQES